MERVMMQANRGITIRSEAGNSMPAKDFDSEPAQANQAQ
jgi:hypothetical protein